MKINYYFLKHVAVLVVVAGCATEPETAKEPEAKPVAAEKKVEAKPADPFKTAYDAQMKAARAWSQHSRPEQVLKNLPDVLAFIESETKKGGHEKEIDTLSKFALLTLWRGRDFATGVPLAERLYANEKADIPCRLEAAHYLAMKTVDERKDYAAADAYYAKLAALNPQPLFLRYEIAKNRAYLYTLREDKAGALAFLEAERAKIPEKDVRVRGYFDEAINEVYVAFFDAPGRLAYWQKRGDKYQEYKVYASGGVMDFPRGLAAARDVIANDPQLVHRREAWMWAWGRDTAFCKANLAKVLDATPASTNALYNSLGGVFTMINRRNPQGGVAPGWDKDWRCLVDTWELYRELGRKAGLPVRFEAAAFAAYGFAGLRDREKALAAAKEGLTNEKLKPAERYALELMVEILSLKGDAKAMAAKLAEAEPRLAGDLAAKDRKTGFERAGALPVILCDESVARVVADYYRQHMDPVLPRKVYTVKFSDRRVSGPSDWANLPIQPEESPFDRKFGGPGADFLVTDVTTGDRGNAVQGGEKSREFPTTLRVVADEWGVHFLYTYYDRRVRQIEAGDLDGGGFESYIAAGENQPYSSLLCRLQKRARVRVMSTAYDTPGHRRIVPSDPETVRCETVFTDDKAMQYTAFSWDLFAERVPADGGTWDFESIFWGPVQGAWNGTASIHGRSTWGLLKFELGDAARAKILKQQLFRAVGLYKAEKTPGGTFEGSAQEGVFDHWQDDGVGDPAFYEKCLKPLVAELDAAAERVKVGMTDADVKELSEKYLSRFLNVRYEVARLRAAYLKGVL